ncbi:MAG: AAA family ATPase [Euzebya sp.]
MSDGTGGNEHKSAQAADELLWAEETVEPVAPPAQTTPPVAADGRNGWPQPGPSEQADESFLPPPPSLARVAPSAVPPPDMSTASLQPGPHAPGDHQAFPPNQFPAPGPARLDEATVLRPRADQPSGGWRAWLYRITGGAINMGPSRAEQAWNALVSRCQAPCDRDRRIAVISRKGGVGKTTTTLMIGHTLAALRHDRVIAIDGNPDAGTLGHRVTRQTEATVIDALARIDSVVGYPDARALTSQAPSRLEVMASPQDPHASRALHGSDYQRVMAGLDKHYNVMLCDTGTGIMDDANLGILDAVDQIVLVSGTALDSARAASLTLDWLQTNGRAELVRDAVVVLNSVGGMGRVDVDQVARHFADRCRSVHRVPYDRHLETGSITDPDLLAPVTQQAWLDVAAAVVDGFALTSPRVRR